MFARQSKVDVMIYKWGLADTSRLQVIRQQLVHSNPDL